jgi:hypothetical protein
MRYDQALGLVLMLGVEGHLWHPWHRPSPPGVGIKAQPHGDKRVAAPVVEIDHFVEFQPGRVRGGVNDLHLEQHVVALEEATDLVTIVQQGYRTLPGGCEAIVLLLDLLQKCTRALAVQRAVEGLLCILQGLGTVRELVSD